jgi:hypothetical protein
MFCLIVCVLIALPPKFIARSIVDAETIIAEKLVATTIA